MTNHKTNEQGMIPAAQVEFKDGYRYQVYKKFYASVDIYPSQDIATDFLSLSKHGLLCIDKGYATDGPSGPTKMICDILTILGCIPFIGRFFNWQKFKILNSIMRGAVVHDALYEFQRKELLPQAARLPADKELRKICLEDDMSNIRAGWVFTGVRKGAGYAARPEHKKQVYKTPI